MKSAQARIESENNMLRKDLQALKNEISYINNMERSQNVVLFNVKDCDVANKDLSAYVMNIMKEADIEIPEESI